MPKQFILKEATTGDSLYVNGESQKQFCHITRVVSSHAGHLHFIGLLAEVPDTSNSKLLHKKLPALTDTTEVRKYFWVN